MKNILVKQLFFGIGLFAATTSSAQYQVQDVFGRNIISSGIVLTDWEGYMANPAIELTIAPVSGSQTITLTANHSRLYFDMPSSVGASGPSKTIFASTGNPVTVYLSIFPDRDGNDETYSLTLSSGAGTLQIPIQVIDQDDPGRSLDFSIPLDFSQDDPAYNFFNNTTRVATVTEAANDWAYFLADQGFDPVNAGAEQTYIWGDNYASGSWYTNTVAYNGFLIYPHGFDHVDNRSGGAPSNFAFQTIGENNTELRRSGAYEAEKDGNFNTLGWLNTLPDDQWYQATNLGSVQNDLYSIALHEMGHALVFNPAHTQFGFYKNLGYIDAGVVSNYYGGSLPINAFDHFDDGTLLVDPISKRGAFGSEYANQMPLGRWLITKLNLLALQSIGYGLRNVSFLDPLTATDQTLDNGTANGAYSSSFAAAGGLKTYHWTVLIGTLPNGLSLNPFTGAVTGTPTQSGTFPLEIQLVDNENTSVNFETTLLISGPLPVEFLEGPKAELQGADAIAISWTTASELRVQDFTVERSADLKYFEEISIVPAVGTSSNAHFYQIMDKTPYKSINYYRIRSTDTDGKVTFSNVVAVLMPQKGYRIGPNPVNHYLQLQSEQEWTYEYCLMDAVGHTVLKGQAEGFMQVNTANLPNGLYRIQLTTADRDVQTYSVLVAH